MILIANSKLLYTLGKSSLFVFMLSTFFQVVWEREKYLLSTHFARTNCNAMWGWGCQVWTAGSKDPNNQCVHIYSTHFVWTSCTTRGWGCQVCTAGSKDPLQLSVHKTIFLHVLHFVFLVHTLCLAQFHCFVLLYIYTWVPYLYSCTLSSAYSSVQCSCIHYRDEWQLIIHEWQLIIHEWQLINHGEVWWQNCPAVEAHMSQVGSNLRLSD